jgi:hypothetical protein
MGMRRLPGHLAWLVMLPLAACAPQLSSELGDEASVAQHTGPLITDSRSGATLTESWAQYTINVGAHSASVSGATPGNPVSLFTWVAGRDYRFRFNSSASYVITRPTEPSDQFDWNKLPGISDCGTLDLSVNGAMFGWRWRLDTTPQVLEVTAYANNNSKHLTPSGTAVYAGCGGPGQRCTAALSRVAGWQSLSVSSRGHGTRTFDWCHCRTAAQLPGHLCERSEVGLWILLWGHLHGSLQDDGQRVRDSIQAVGWTYAASSQLPAWRWGSCSR